LDFLGDWLNLLWIMLLGIWLVPFQQELDVNPIKSNILVLDELVYINRCMVLGMSSMNVGKIPLGFPTRVSSRKYGG
jgi:hypothetical protein